MPFGPWFSPERGRPLTSSVRDTTAPCALTTSWVRVPEAGSTVESAGLLGLEDLGVGVGHVEDRVAALERLRSNAMPVT